VLFASVQLHQPPGDGDLQRAQAAMLAALQSGLRWDQEQPASRGSAPGDRAGGAAAAAAPWQQQLVRGGGATPVALLAASSSVATDVPAATQQPERQPPWRRFPPVPLPWETAGSGEDDAAAASSSSALQIDPTSLIPGSKNTLRTWRHDEPQDVVPVMCVEMNGSRERVYQVRTQGRGRGGIASQHNTRS
jgi:hypothetical protein